MTYIPFQILRTGFNINSRVVVTTNKKLVPKDMVKKGILGNTVKYLGKVGNQASILYTGKKMYIPLEAILGYNDFTQISRPALSDTVLVVARTHYTYPIGTVIQTSVINAGTRNNPILTFLDEKGNSHQLDDSFYALSVISPKADKKTVETLKDKFNVKPAQTKVETVKAVELKKFTVLPKDSPIFSVSPSIRKFECVHDQLHQLLTECKGSYTDMKGVKHTSLVACIKSNQLYMDQLYLALSNDILKQNITNV